MEKESKYGTRVLPDDYTPAFLIDDRSLGTMGVILFVGIFFFNVCMIGLPVLMGVEFTLALPGFENTPQQVAFLLVVLVLVLAMWNIHELVRLILCAVASGGKGLKYKYRPMIPAASVKGYYWHKKPYLILLLLPAVLFTLLFFVGMAVFDGPLFWMCLLFQVTSLFSCLHPLNTLIAIKDLPPETLVHREGFVTKFYAPGRQVQEAVIHKAKKLKAKSK